MFYHMSQSLISRRPGISICIPNWNHRQYLYRTLHSAFLGCEELRRIGFGAEIVVVDDASRDGSQRVLAALMARDPSVSLRVEPLDRNGGVVHARNIALKLAGFTHAFMLDSDNEVTPANLPTLFRAARDLDAAMVYGNLVFHDHLGKVSHLYSNDVFQDRMYRSNFIDTMSLIDVSKILRRGGYLSAPYAAAHEDWDLACALVAEQEIVAFVPVIMGHYHELATSMLKTTPFDPSKFRRVHDARRLGSGHRISSTMIYHPDLGRLA
jgi:glycosyltransferase involved in cell wall biosynthesis